MEIKINDYIEKLNKNQVISFVPRGDSMWPTLKNKGQSVIVSAKKETSFFVLRSTFRNFGAKIRIN